MNIERMKELAGINEISDLPLDQSGKFAGWIAIFQGKKLEIKKGEAKDLWGAKQLAIKKLNVPQSKTGLLAIEPVHESAVNEYLTANDIKIIRSKFEKESFDVWSEAELFIQTIKQHRQTFARIPDQEIDNFSVEHIIKVKKSTEKCTQTAISR